MNNTRHAVFHYVKFTFLRLLKRKIIYLGNVKKRLEDLHFLAFNYGLDALTAALEAQIGHVENSLNMFKLQLDYLNSLSKSSSLHEEPSESDDLKVRRGAVRPGLASEVSPSSREQRLIPQKGE